MEPRSLLSGVFFQAWTPSIWKPGSSVLCSQFSAVRKESFFGRFSASRDVVITRFITGFKAWRSSLEAWVHCVALPCFYRSPERTNQTFAFWADTYGRTHEGCSVGCNHIAGCHKEFWMIQKERSVVFVLLCCNPEVTFISFLSWSVLFSFSNTVHGRFLVFFSQFSMFTVFKVKPSPKCNLGFFCECIWVKPLDKSIVMTKEALLRFTVFSFFSEGALLQHDSC